MKDAAKAILAVVAAGALLAVLYFGYWALARDTTDRRVGIDNRQKGTQTAWHDEAIDLFNEADLIEGTPQAEALRRQACQLSARLTDSYRDDIIIEMESLHC